MHPKFSSVLFFVRKNNIPIIPYTSIRKWYRRTWRTTAVITMEKAALQTNVQPRHVY
jgi:hypothetical protein